MGTYYFLCLTIILIIHNIFFSSFGLAPQYELDPAGLRDTQKRR